MFAKPTSLKQLLNIRIDRLPIVIILFRLFVMYFKGTNLLEKGLLIRLNK